MNYGYPDMTKKLSTDIVYKGIAANRCSSSKLRANNNLFERRENAVAFLPFRDRARIVLFRWPAIVAGVFVALGIHIVLTAFGLGVLFLQSQSADGGSSMATAALLLWSGLSWVAAGFIGGYVTAWVADASRYVESVFHGLVLWGALTFILMFLPPSTMGISAEAEPALSPSLLSSVAWFVAIGGLLSLGTTIWGAVIGSRVIADVETKEGSTYRAA